MYPHSQGASAQECWDTEWGWPLQCAQPFPVAKHLLLTMLTPFHSHAPRTEHLVEALPKSSGGYSMLRSLGLCHSSNLWWPRHRSPAAESRTTAWGWKWPDANCTGSQRHRQRLSWPLGAWTLMIHPKELGKLGWKAQYQHDLPAYLSTVSTVLVWMAFWFRQLHPWPSWGQSFQSPARTDADVQHLPWF